METLIFLPKPERICFSGQRIRSPGKWSAHVPKSLEGICQGLGSLWPELMLETQGSGNIQGNRNPRDSGNTRKTWESQAGEVSFFYEKKLPEEGYWLELRPEGAVVGYGSAKGAYYGMVTLHQAVLQCPDDIPCCKIEDKPGLKIRGALLDISRGKVPKLETLKKLADTLAALKYNHLELYIEGFAFGYPSFPEVWQTDSCLLPGELEELCVYCRERFIELVPQQNSFGHMAPWLGLPEYKGLAEAEDGLEVMGMKFPPTTLDVSDPGSLELVKRLAEDIGPSFGSKWFHAGLDEAFEFGKGKNKELVEQQGATALILSYIKRLHKILGNSGYRMMMWDDLLVKYPELFQKLPEDILVFNWGYDGEYPVEQRARALKESGRPFCLAPGTSSWSSFTGLTDNMLENIRRAGQAAHEYGAEGMVVTDWGDMNHLQYQPVSYPGLAFAAAWAWNKEGVTERELADSLSTLVFADPTKIMGEFCLNAGRFYQEEEFRLPCRSLACLPLMFGKLSKEMYEERVEWLAKSVEIFSPKEVSEEYLKSYRQRKSFDECRLYGFLEERLAELRGVSLACPDGPRIVREYQNAIKMQMYLTEAREEILRGRSCEKYKKLYPEILEEHRLLWLERNKKSGLEEGIRMFGKVSP